MTTSFNAKMAIAALAVVTPLTLVACGSDEETTETTSAPSTITSTRTTSSTTSSAESTTETTSTEPTTEAAAEPTPLADPLANLPEGSPVAPVAGAPASEADYNAINGLVSGLYQQTTMHSFLRYMPDNTCHAVVEANGGAGNMDLAGIPDVPLNQMPAYAQSQPHIQSVDNVNVDGSVASANVTVVTSGQTGTSTVRFLHEDGRWKFCN